MKAIISLFFIILTVFTAAAEATPALEPVVRATIHSDTQIMYAGKPFRLGVYLEPRHGWHTYWENPGDAGLPTGLAWTLPEGFTAGTIDWPSPARIEEGPLVIYGYEGPVFLPVSITPPATFPNHPLLFKVNASWLVCDDICIPESTELTITLPLEMMKPQSGELFAAHDAAKPMMVAIPATYTGDEKTVTLSTPLAALNLQDATVKNAHFFARKEGVVRYATPQTVMVDDGVLHLVVERSEAALPETLNGLLMVSTENGDTYFDIAFQPAEAAALQNSQATAAPSSPWLPAILLFALLGGLILNLMPCVLPVLSLKALAVVKKSGAHRQHVLAQGVAYTLGILVSFAVIAAILLIIKETGEAVGWGYQMQSPAFVGFLVYLLFLVGLSLSGYFYLPVVFGNLGASVTEASSTKGSFLTGVLAVAVATPCTAPFMASAVGAALTFPAWQSMLVFEALGLGLALPFLLISFFPSLLAFLPKPGAWMETFKQFLAFPMYASVIWLLWVLDLQTGNGGVAIALCGMLALVVVLWMKQLFSNPEHYQVAAVVLFAIIFVVSLTGLNRMEASLAMPLAAEEHEVTTQPFSQMGLDMLVAEGKPVFVDATAAWCITCQLNAKVALHTDRVMEAFRQKGVTLMVADWTRRNDEITRFLTSFGYRGVPLYVYYPPGKDPRVLPQILTPDIVINALDETTPQEGL